MNYVVTVHQGYQCCIFIVYAINEAEAIGKVAKLARYKDVKTVVRAYPVATHATPHFECYVVTE